MLWIITGTHMKKFASLMLILGFECFTGEFLGIHDKNPLLRGKDLAKVLRTNIPLIPSPTHNI